MTDWRLAVARAKEEFGEGLARRGFRHDAKARVFRGKIPLPGGDTRTIAIEISDDFPFVPPKVRPVDGDFVRSWHRERDGALCLWPSAARHPWIESSALLDRVTLWFVRDTAGWPEDEPDLDLERYFDRVDGLVVYRNVEQLVGHRLRVHARGPVIDVVGALPEGKKGRKHRQHDFGGWAASLGELTAPVYDWATVAPALGRRGDAIAEEIHKGSGHLLLLHYTRRGQSAAIALLASRGGPVKLRAYEAADATRPTLKLRSGPAAAHLADRSAAIVGVGAVGSFLADLLAREGVGHLYLQDGEVLRPGNCIRHLAGIERVGLQKAQAVKEILVATGRMHPRHVTASNTSLLRPADAEGLLARHDVVIDATAAGKTSSMLAVVAESSGRPFLSVCVQREGGIARCDRWPLRAGESHLPAVPLGRPASAAREAGCGDPVSLTPPSSTVAAAELAARVIRDLLTGANRLPPTLIHVLSPQTDAPYDRLTILA